MAIPEIVKALNLKDNSAEFLKINPDICERKPDEIGYLFLRRLKFEEDRLKNQYIMEGLNFFLGYFPTEEQLISFAKDEVLGFIDAYTLKKPTIPGTPYRKVWMYGDDKVLLKQKPWDYVTESKVRFNFFHRVTQKTYSFGEEPKKRDVVEWKPSGQNSIKSVSREIRSLLKPLPKEEGSL